ncbi:hypothetical protein LG200_09655 [Methylobacillus caricis]|uniref:hypothetical protein n=1 Tax=Methylobacillus caricis TaxID=1971611 RepID=UPI001CFF6F6C|nr:hypothetical protein [Methylobacillus caricis]MCB5188262.1 hypothetical protein [Methylobacillus caricis]
MDSDLIALEEKLGQLISLCHLLRAENLELRQELVSAQDDNKHLKENMALATTRLEALIERLPEGTL